MDDAVESVFIQVEQSMGGMYGDYMGVALATAGAVAAVLRPFPAFSGLLTDTSFMLNADIILFCAVALWTQGGHSIYHTHLVLLLFLASCFLRFSATWPDDGSSSSDTFQALVNRSLRRLSEFTLLIFPARVIVRRSNASHPAAVAVFIASFAVLVASSRAYEAFRPWRLHQKRVVLKSPSEEMQLRQVLHYVRQAGGAIPESKSSADNQPLLPNVQKYSDRCGNAEEQRHAHDLAFMWLNGSVPLIIAAVAVLSALISTMEGASRHGTLAVWIKCLYIFALTYVFWRSLPGCIGSILADINIGPKVCHCGSNDAKSTHSTATSFTLAGCLMHTHIKSIKLWSSDMWEFWRSSVAASPDLPTRCKSLPKFCSRFVGFVEGAELSIHIVVACFSRLIFHSIFICILLLFYSFVIFLSRSCRALDTLVRSKKNGPMSRTGDLTGTVTGITSDGSTSGSTTNSVTNGGNVRSDDVRSGTACKLLGMSKFTRLIYLACRSELRVFDRMYPPEQPSYVILGVQFLQMNMTSTHNLSPPLEFPETMVGQDPYLLQDLMYGYFWLEKEQLQGLQITNQDDWIGYAYLKGKLLDLPWHREFERASMYGVVGGWITLDNKEDKYYPWGDTSIDSDSSIKEVGRFYAGVSYINYLEVDESHPNYSKPFEVRVWLKFGYCPIRISHVWVGDKSLIPDCLCIPNIKDPNIKCLAMNISSYPELSTFRAAVVL